jgi:hypothetical protein
MAAVKAGISSLGVIPADAGIQLARERAKQSSTSGIRRGDASNCGHDNVLRLGDGNGETPRLGVGFYAAKGTAGTTLHFCAASRNSLVWR